MQIKALEHADLSAMWDINEQGLPGTGKVTLEEMKYLLSISEISIGAFDDGSLCGFVICFLPKRAYRSLNYAWFNQRYENFIYVDRIAVATTYRNQGIGTALYQSVFEYAARTQQPVTAEVSLQPPNPGSDRFHQTHGFLPLEEVDYGDKAVTMYIRPIISSDD